MKVLTRRQRQKKKKKDAMDIAKAEEIIKSKYAREFDLYNSFGIKDPVPRRVWFKTNNYY